MIFSESVSHRIAVKSAGHTSIITVWPRAHELCILQPGAQGAHSAWASEEGVPPGPKRAQLLHPPLFRSAVLKPYLKGENMVNWTAWPAQAVSITAVM